MPIFEYSCSRSNHCFEAIVLSREEKTSCPACASTAVEKQLSVFSAPASAKETGSSISGGGCCCTPETCGCS